MTKPAEVFLICSLPGRLKQKSLNSKKLKGDHHLQGVKPKIRP